MRKETDHASHQSVDDIGKILHMSRRVRPEFASEEATDAVGADRAAPLRAFRLLSVISNQIRWLTDDMLRGDNVTSQQAALTTVVNSLGRPSISEVAGMMSTSHQNVKQIALGLERKGFMRIELDDRDGRVRRLVTTPRSNRFWAARDPLDFDVIADWFSSLSAVELTTLVALLARVNEELQREIDLAKTPPR